jgi:hypothetical protein
MFADLTNASGFDRYAVNTPAEYKAFLAALDAALSF